MITSEKIFRLVEAFERMLPHAKGRRSLDMFQGWVSHDSGEYEGKHKCGTVHCHAGWYLLAKEWDGESATLARGYGDYDDGRELMKADLGASPGRWASLRPEIWGNDFGGRMFFCERAFISPDRPDGAETLQDIVDHWGEVGMRLLLDELYRKGEDDE